MAERGSMLWQHERVLGMSPGEEFRFATDCSREFLPLPPAGKNSRRVWDYWNSRRQDLIAPSRNDIDPFDLVDLMPQLLLVDVETDPVRFCYRLSGSQADTIHGHALKGVYADEMEPEAFGKMLQDDFSRIVEERIPHMVRLTFVNREGQSRAYNVLRMPLIGDKDEVNMILIFTNFKR